MRTDDNCECGEELECLAGCSAHPDNWYCPKCDRKDENKFAALPPNYNEESRVKYNLVTVKLGE